MAVAISALPSKVLLAFAHGYVFIYLILHAHCWFSAQNVLATRFVFTETGLMVSNFDIDNNRHEEDILTQQGQLNCFLVDTRKCFLCLPIGFVSGRRCCLYIVLIAFEGQAGVGLNVRHEVVDRCSSSDGLPRHAQDGGHQERRPSVCRPSLQQLGESTAQRDESLLLCSMLLFLSTELLP